MAKRINWSKIYSKIPSSVIIGKNTYNVLWIDNFPKDSQQLGESSFHPDKQIVINLNQSHKEAVHTYWHELLHVMSYEYDADLTEGQVKKLEKSLPFLLKKDNIFRGDKNGKIQRNKTYKRKRRDSKRICETCKKAR